MHGHGFPTCHLALLPLLAFHVVTAICILHGGTEILQTRLELCCTVPAQTSLKFSLCQSWNRALLSLGYPFLALVQRFITVCSMQAA